MNGAEGSAKKEEKEMEVSISCLFTAQVLFFSRF
jgi:hypothetical protein